MPDSSSQEFFLKNPLDMQNRSEDSPPTDVQTGRNDFWCVRPRPALRSSVMYRSGSSGVKNAQRPACVFSSYAAPPSAPALGKAPRHRKNTFLLARFLTIFAACLGVLFVSYIALEAVDGDVNLWPFGAESFIGAAKDQHVIGGQPFSVSFILALIQCFVMTAGAHLVMKHRARSALAADYPTLSAAFQMAEPWVQDLRDAPVLGHFFVGHHIKRQRKIYEHRGGRR